MGSIADVCRRHRITQELTTPNSAPYDGAAERALGIIEKVSKAARIEAPLLFPEAEVPDFSQTGYLWAEAMLWACDSLNRTATTSNPDRKTPHEMFYGTIGKVRMIPFLKPAFYRPGKDQPKDQPRAIPCFYMGPGLDRMHDSMRVLTPNKTVITTRHVTWRAPRSPMVISSPETETGRDCFYGCAPPKPAISLTSLSRQSYSVFYMLKTNTRHTNIGPKTLTWRTSDLGGEPQHGRYVSELGLKPAPKMSLFRGGAIVETLERRSRRPGEHGRY